MWSPVAQVFLSIALYLYAGHLTWWRMLLTDPQGASCGIAAAVAEGTLPFIVYAFFILFWVPLMLIGWTANKLQA